MTLLILILLVVAVLCIAFVLFGGGHRGGASPNSGYHTPALGLAALCIVVAAILVVTRVGVGA